MNTTRRNFLQLALSAAGLGGLARVLPPATITKVTMAAATALPRFVNAAALGESLKLESAVTCYRRPQTFKFSTRAQKLLLPGDAFPSGLTDCQGRTHRFEGAGWIDEVLQEYAPSGQPLTTYTVSVYQLIA